MTQTGQDQLEQPIQHFKAARRQQDERWGTPECEAARVRILKADHAASEAEHALKAAARRQDDALGCAWVDALNAYHRATEEAKAAQVEAARHGLTDPGNRSGRIYVVDVCRSAPVFVLSGSQAEAEEQMREKGQTLVVDEEYFQGRRP